MKKLLTALTVLLGFSVSVTAQVADFETATEAVAHMGVGWNLGNTLDSHDGNLNKEFTGWLSRETYWSEPPTTPRVIKMMKNAGFNVIRVPVTWYPDMDADGNVSADWMKRVHDVVDMVINEGMYCLLNVHHDTGTTKGAWLIADIEDYQTKKNKFEYLWQQIANEFINYGEKLLFEGYNEMLDPYNSWGFASYNTTDKYNENVATSAYNAINAYAQSFVNAVRGTGGNNLQRNLVCSIYCASEGTGADWNTHLQDPAKNMVMPIDVPENRISVKINEVTIPTSKHLAVEMHYYRTLPYVTSKRNYVDWLMENLNTHLANRLGVPVIIGEWGPRYETDEDKALYSYLERDNLLSFANYFVTKAKENGFATMYWMGMSNKLARLWPYFNQPKLAETVLKAYHGEDYKPDIPTIDKYNYDYTEVTFAKEWGEFNMYKGEALSLDDYSGIRVELAEYPVENNKLQIRAYGDPSDLDHFSETKFANTEKVKTLNFDKEKMNGKLTRAAIVNCIYGEHVVKVKHAYLIRKDGTEEETVFSCNNRCTITDIVAHRNGSATVAPTYDYELSEDNGITSPEGMGGKTAVFKRTFQKDIPATICLPFYVRSELADLVGKFYTFGGVNDERTEVTMNEFPTASFCLTANTPYLFIPKYNNEVTFSGTILKTPAPCTKTVGNWTFTGTYNEIRWDNSNNTDEIGTIYGYASGQGYEGTAARVAAGEFVRLRTGGIKPFRAYMKYVAPTTNAPKRAGGADGLPERMTVRLVGTDGTTTAIGTIDTRTGDVSFDTQWFTLDGMRLSNKPSAKGIYIRSDVGRQQGRQSKKVVIK